MSGKKTAPAWRTLLWGLGLTGVIYVCGVLLTTWLALRGVLPEERMIWPVAAAAGIGCLAGGAVCGGGALGPAGSMVNAGAFCALLALLAFGLWEGVTAQGLLPAVMAALGGAGGCLLQRGRTPRRRGTRLVKTNKSRRIS